jgi:hypothetical protein
MYEFMVIQCVCVALVLAFPSIAMWFPQWLEEGDRMAVPLQKDGDEPATESLENYERKPVTDEK